MEIMSDATTTITVQATTPETEYTAATSQPTTRAAAESQLREAIQSFQGEKPQAEGWVTEDNIETTGFTAQTPDGFKITFTLSEV